LRLTPEVLTGIYLGEIRYWSDPKILAVNPRLRASLIPANITLVTRAESSATSFTLIDYLSRVSSIWKTRVATNTTITWPVSGLNAADNEGVADIVRRTPYSIGYLDYAWSVQNKIPSAAVQNRDGHFVVAQTKSLSAAAESAAESDGANADFRESITNAPGEYSYPITSFTYLLVPQKIEDSRKRAALSGFLTWMLTEGQRETASFQYEPLPSGVVAREKRRISLIK
jgi:phosphate transport system substrate-binding protein